MKRIVSWIIRVPSRDGGTGRRAGLKIRCPRGCGGSSPPPGTKHASEAVRQRLETQAEARVSGLFHSVGVTGGIFRGESHFCWGILPGFNREYRREQVQRLKYRFAGKRKTADAGRPPGACGHVDHRKSLAQAVHTEQGLLRKTILDAPAGCAMVADRSHAGR